ncbi:E-selectin-like [Daphnia pulicaria]|uniref:E-selectin-like n=1 Tax=Daphnia pulicaria TaxID=35523 RepID=UPI001EE9D45E|nr:E-selectin-like [Daphnia pulicaria]
MGRAEDSSLSTHSLPRCPGAETWNCQRNELNSGQPDYFQLPGRIFQLNGEEQITCRPDGTWSHPAMPICVTRSCGDPPNIDNGFAVVRGTGVGDTISYSYETGHRLSGVESRTCLSNGRWSAEDPACDPVVCAVPEASEHGSWTNGGFVPGSTIRFECKPGFTLVGSATVRCLTDKSWSDRPPSCQQITCPPLRDPEHGIVQLTNWISDNQELNNQQLAVGYHSTAHYTCNRGYQLFGLGQRTCTDQGTWSDRGPKCQRVWCNEPQAPLQGFVMGTGRQYCELATGFATLVAPAIG